MSDWHETKDYIDDIWSRHKEKLTVEQEIEIAKTMALLTIAQEINHLRHNGINSEYTGM